MWKHYDFEAILTSNDVLKIQYAIGKGFGSIEREYCIGVNASFVPKRTDRPYTSPTNGTGK